MRENIQFLFFPKNFLYAISVFEIPKEDLRQTNL
jgi:hypothetical protein